MAAPCRPSNVSAVLSVLPIFYIAKAASPALEQRLRRAGACGRIEHVPALMAREVFPPGTPSPFEFRAARRQLNGSADGFRFALRQWPPPAHGKETCAPPSLEEAAILLSHLRAMALAHRHMAAGEPGARPVAALVVEEDVDLRLIGRWLSPSIGVNVPPPGPGGLDAVFAALPLEWGLVQLALITKAMHFKMLRARLAAGERIVPHAQIVGRMDGKNEGWSTAAYAVSPGGLRAMLDAYWPGQAAGALARGGAHAAPDGVLQVSHKPCLRADFLLYDGHVAPAHVSTQPLFLFRAGSASRASASEGKRVSGIQIKALSSILTLFYGFSLEDARRVIVENSPGGAAPVRKGRGWRAMWEGPAVQRHLQVDVW